MVGDITYIPTWEGWLFLATVIDCHTKAVHRVGHRRPLPDTADHRGDRHGRPEQRHSPEGDLPFRPGQPA